MPLRRYNAKVKSITVRKLDVHGTTLLCWPASILQHTPEFLQVEARFSHSDRLQLDYAVFERGDRFVEWFFTARWFSIYQIFGVSRQPSQRLVLQRDAPGAVGVPARYIPLIWRWICGWHPTAASKYWTRTNLLGCS